MAYSIDRMVIYDSVLYNRTGEVGRWARRVEKQFTANAIQEAPLNKRSVKSRANAMYPRGSLKASISGATNRVGVRHVQVTLSVDVPYALAVLKGTSRIYSRSARDEGGRFTPLSGNPDDYQGGMYIPPGMGHRAMIRQSVSGQSANPFIQRAIDATARTHPSLRGANFR